MAIETVRTSSVSDSSALLRKGSDKQKNSTSTGTISRTNSEKRGNKKQSRSTGENTTSTVTILSERRQHRKQMAQSKTSKQDDEEDDVFTKKDMVTKNEKLDRWVSIEIFVSLRTKLIVFFDNILSDYNSQFVSGLEIPELVLLAASLLQRMLQTLVLGK